jgi:hypothetical protein
VAVAALRGNKPSWAFSHPGGASLTHCLQARGGGASCVELLYRRPAPIRLCLRRTVEVRGFGFIDVVQGGGVADD